MKCTCRYQQFSSLSIHFLHCAQTLLFSRHSAEAKEAAPIYDWCICQFQALYRIGGTVCRSYNSLNRKPDTPSLPCQKDELHRVSLVCDKAQEEVEAERGGGDRAYSTLSSIRLSLASSCRSRSSFLRSSISLLLTDLPSSNVLPISVLEPQSYASPSEE